MDNIIEIEGIKSFDLNIPTQAIDFIIHLGGDNSTKHISLESIVLSCTNQNLKEYLITIQKSNNSFFNVANDIRKFFIFFFHDLEFNNVFYKYFIENDIDSEIVKKLKIKSLISSLQDIMDYYDDFYSISKIDYYFSNFKPELRNQIKDDNSIALALPVYHIHHNFKVLYDLLWDSFNLFIDTTKHTFSYSYSNKKRTIDNQKKELTETNKEENPFPDIFKEKETYLNFNEYLSKYIVKPHIDLSYLFRRLLDERLIHKLKDKEIFEWLLKNEKITSRIYTKLYEIGSFKSLDKSETDVRENNFDSTFNI